jgi:hypothetical protein
MDEREFDVFPACAFRESLFYLAHAVGWPADTDHVLIAPVREELAINFLRAANGLVITGPARRRAVASALEGYADFVLLLRRLKGGINEHADEDNAS